MVQVQGEHIMHCWHYGGWSEGDLGNSCNMSLSLSWWISGYLQIWRSMSVGGAYPLPLMSKGENEAEDYEVSIKSKGGDCWHYGSGVVLDGNPFRW